MAKEVTFKLNLKIDGKDVVKKLTVDVEELQRAMGETRSITDKLASSLIKINQLNAFAQNISSGISQLSSALGTVTEESRGFGAAMASANTMAGKSGEDFANLKDQVAELSKTIPVAREELANGLYQVISNGVPEDNWIEYLRKSAKASVGGIADLGETVKVTSTIIKNYGLQWSDAGSIQDKIQLTAKNGVTSFEQLAQALPRVTSQASTLGVSIDELMATFSTLTGVSGNTAEVSTQLAAIFTALIKPSSEAAEMAQQMGIQFDAASIKAAGGMEQFLATLDKSVKQYAASSGMLEQEIYGKLFGSAESLRALGPLTGQLANKFRENVSAMQGSAGTVDEAFDTMASTGSATIQLLNNKLGEYTDKLQGSIGNITPYITFGAQMATMAASLVSLGSSFMAVAKSAKAASLAIAAYNKATAIAMGLSTAPLLALAACLGVVAVGYSKVKAQVEDTDRKARELRESLANLKKEHDSNNEAIRKYLPIAQDATKKTADRKEAIAKLKALYPDYFKNLDIATSKQYDIAKAVNASNKAYRDQLVLIAKQAKVQYEKSRANYEKNQNGGQMGGTNAGMNVVMNLQDKANMEADLKLMKEAEKAVKDYDKAMQQPAAKVSTGAQGNAGNGIKKTLKVAEMNLQQIEKAIEQTETKLKNTTNKAQISSLRAYERQLQARKKALEKETGIGSYTTKNGKHTQEPKFYKDPKTLEQLDKNINYYQGKISPGNTAEDQRLRKQIQLWQEKKNAIELANKAAERPLRLDSVDAYEKDMSVLRSMINASTVDSQTKKLQNELEGRQRELGMFKIKMGIETIPPIEIKKETKGILQKIDEQMADFVKNFKPIEIEVRANTKDFKKAMEHIKDGWGSIRGVGSGIEGITNALDDNRNAWQAVSGMIDGFLSIADGISSIVSLIKTLTGATEASSAATAVNTTVTAANTATSATNTVAKSGEAIANATASGAKMPFPANIVAIAAGVAAVVAALAMISGAFTDGGIVGGDSPSGDKLLARVNSGEMILNAAQQARLFAIANGAAVYGAAAQVGTDFARGAALPGVTVSSDSLRSIISDGDGGAPRSISLRLRGRDLVGAVANETRSNRKRSNIKIG